MNSRAESYIRVAILVLSLSVVGTMAGLIGMHPVTGVVEGQIVKDGCQFQIYLRPPIEFAGPAGGADFEVHNPTKYRADIQVANAYGTQPCSWNAAVNQNWITLSQSNGTLQPEADTLVTVSINDRATQLSRGVHSGEITFTSRQDAHPNFSKKVKVILHAQEPCDLQVIGGTYRARALQGEIPAEISRATLNNGGDAPCRWQAHSDVSWLTVTPTAGTVLPRNPQQITIKANGGVANLVPTDYEATVRLQWRETHDEYQELEAVLEIDAPPCELHFDPGQRFEVAGKAGSTEFLPAQQIYLLGNHGGTPCFVWQAHHTARWLSVDDNTTIYPGNATEVLVRVNQGEAAEVRPGTYDNTITFGAGNQYARNGVQARLTVEPEDCRLQIVDEELFFIIKPEGLIQSETERLFRVTNDWKNEECYWSSESAVDWLTSVPDAGALAGGETTTVLAKIVQSDDFAKLDAGSHTATLGFKVASGTADEPIPVTVKIDCQAGVPCAYLHTSHTKTAVGKPADISLTLYNPHLPRPCDQPRKLGNDHAAPTPTPCIDDGSITAQLVAEVPSGWQVSIGNLTERCSGICNRSYTIVGGQQEFIELIAVPNNEGVFDFAATVYWGSNAGQSVADGESTDDRKFTKLRAEVKVAAQEVGDTPAQAVQQIATQAAPTLAPQAEPVSVSAVETATPEPDEPVLTESQIAQPSGGTTPAGSQGAWQGGISAQWLFLGIAVIVIVVVVAIVGAILVGFKMLANAQRRTPPSQSEPAAERE